MEVVICERAGECDIPEASCRHKTFHAPVSNCVDTICWGARTSCITPEAYAGITISPFKNESGGLSMLSLAGISYLKMQGACEARWFGPLTANQVSAFRLLSDVPAAFHDESKDGEGCE